MQKSIVINDQNALINQKTVRDSIASEGASPQEMPNIPALNTTESIGSPQTDARTEPDAAAASSVSKDQVSVEMDDKDVASGSVDEEYLKVLIRQ